MKTIQVQGYTIRYKTSGSYAPKRKFQPEQFPDVIIKSELPEEVSEEDVRERVIEEIKSEKRKSRAQRRAEHKAEKL